MPAQDHSDNRSKNKHGDTEFVGDRTGKCSRCGNSGTVYAYDSQIPHHFSQRFSKAAMKHAKIHDCSKQRYKVRCKGSIRPTRTIEWHQQWKCEGGVQCQAEDKKYDAINENTSKPLPYAGARECLWCINARPQAVQQNLFAFCADPVASGTKITRS